MHLGLRLLFGFFLICGIAAVFVLRVFLAEVKPAVREVMEDTLVDAAHALAEQAAPDVAALGAMSAAGAAGGSATLEGTRFAAGMREYLTRPVDARIWGLHKRTLDLRVYVTDANGRLLFESGNPAAAGTDYSRWRDVALTLRGEYGARSTRAVLTDERSSVMYVAAPIRAAGDARTIGVLTVARPVAAVQPYIDRAEGKILVAGVWLLGLSLAVGVAVTLWTVHAVRKLRRYAQQAGAGAGAPVAAPVLPGELGELARAMASMRDRLDGRARVEQSMRALTHELKSPLTAIGGAAELLHDELPRADRERFAVQIGEQVERLQGIVDRLLELSKLEALTAPARRDEVDLAALVREQLAAMAPTLAQRGLQAVWLRADAIPLRGDRALLALAASNLLANAADFAPPGSTLELAVTRAGGQVELALRDYGPGVPDFAQPQLGTRFFSTPRPRDGRKGSGLGLAIVRQVVALHGGGLAFENAAPGLRVRLTLPLAPG